MARLAEVLGAGSSWHLAAFLGELPAPLCCLAAPRPYGTCIPLPQLCVRGLALKIEML